MCFGSASLEEFGGTGLSVCQELVSLPAVGVQAQQCLQSLGQCCIAGRRSRFTGKEASSSTPRGAREEEPRPAPVLPPPSPHPNPVGLLA